MSSSKSIRGSGSTSRYVDPNQAFVEVKVETAWHAGAAAGAVSGIAALVLLSIVHSLGLWLSVSSVFLCTFLGSLGG
jgi:hypothetical protein